MKYLIFLYHPPKIISWNKSFIYLFIIVSYVVLKCCIMHHMNVLKSLRARQEVTEYI